MKINKWFFIIEGKEAVLYVADFSKEKVNDNEIALCIQEQFYNKK